ncbi:hypothetical protein FYK55_19795 [Roseiconus nitratireducens]|uniref:Secreted protein n=1 Tax=Roseiconus nitratireducens TaxID=2605748 RepID=A0A5M6D203_9BACT|nr:hypothetical protein [Roseiconus nitratireducens]KAA5540640.1 hypothetical protein FYK55_19795 [Roseiconus nitratireducens]
MTINKTIRKRLRRYALFCLMAATSTVALEHSRFALSGETHDSGPLCGWVDPLPPSDAGDKPIKPRPQANASLPIAFFSVDVSETLSIDTCNYDAWLAGTIGRLATLRDSDPTAPDQGKLQRDRQAKLAGGEDDLLLASEPTDAPAAPGDSKLAAPPTRSTRTSGHFNSTVAAIAAAATAGNPLPFGHWTEPFAMVGPERSHTVEEIRRFQDWFQESHRMISEYASARNQAPADLATVQWPTAQTSTTPASAPVPAGLGNGVSEQVCQGEFAVDGFVPLVDFDGTLPNASTPEADLALNSSDVDVVPETSSEAGTQPEGPQPDQVVIFELVETTPADADSRPDAVKLLDGKPSDPASVSSPLVGGSAIIASIPEAYSPYDLAERDIQSAPSTFDQPQQDDESSFQDLRWADSLFSPTGQPFCMRSIVLSRQSAWSPLSKSVERDDDASSLPTEGAVIAVDEEPLQVAAKESLPPTDGNAWRGSADCLLDEWAWHAGRTLERLAEIGEDFRAPRIGRQVARLASGGERIAAGVADRVATVWPAAAPAMQRIAQPVVQPVARPVARQDAQQEAEPVAPAAGARLLARAEAAERLPDDVEAASVDQRRLAEATATLLQWVDAGQGIVDQVSSRWSDVTRVARYHGGHGDTEQR